MSKRPFKSQASSSCVSGTSLGSRFATSSTLTQANHTLSYFTEPPNLDNVKDPNVVVLFKGLSKKDDTTKSKALDELRAYVRQPPPEAQGEIEEPILEAWVKLYPRLSIENSRRVRELAHSIQFELLKSGGKRMERHLQQIVGPWLASLYDRDRHIAKEASEYIAHFLKTDDRVLSFWKRSQPQVLEYAQEAFHETPQTLSDERTMSADDVQAKYFRVVESSIALVTNLLLKLDSKEIFKQVDMYKEYLSNNKELWALAASADAHVRRRTCDLLSVCMVKLSPIIEGDLGIISHAFIAEALRSSQSSSSLSLLETLQRLTSKHPQVWTSLYKAKKSSLLRLRTFVEKGSQGGPPMYWEQLGLLLQDLPEGVLPSALETSTEFLQSFRNGITRREEPRNNLPAAWSSYLSGVQLMVKKLHDPMQQSLLLQKSIYPLFEQHLHPTLENDKWSVGSSTEALVKAYNICASEKYTDSGKSFEDEWQRLADEFISRILTSLPEQSKDYEKSQRTVVAESHRWFRFMEAVFNSDPTDDRSKQLLVLLSSKIVAASITAMVNRKGKPYSAAATVEAALELAPSMMKSSPEIFDAVKEFLEHHLLELIFSCSSDYLVSILNQGRLISDQEATFDHLWQLAIDGLLEVPDDANRSRVIIALISNSASSRLAQADSGLQEFLSSAILTGVRGDTEAWNLLKASFIFGLLTESSSTSVIYQIINFLDTNETRQGALEALNFISERQPNLLRRESGFHVLMITKLLALTELSDLVLASGAKKLRARIDAPTMKEENGEQQDPVLHVIRDNLETASPRSLSVNTLLQQAFGIMEKSTNSKNHKELYPDVERWSEALVPLLADAPNRALGVMRPFAGAVFLVQQSATVHLSRPGRDMNGYSVALRMAMYTSGLVTNTRFIEFVPYDTRVKLIQLLALTRELASDQIDLSEGNKLFASHMDPDAIEDVREFVAKAQTRLSFIMSRGGKGGGWLREPQLDEMSKTVRGLVHRLVLDSNAETTTAYYSAKALSRLLPGLFESHQWQDEDTERFLSDNESSVSVIFNFGKINVLGATAVLVALEGSGNTNERIRNFCNRIVSDVSGASVATSHSLKKTLGLLILLNASLSVYEIDSLPVAQPRIIFGVKQIMSWMQSAALGNDVASEACRALQRLLPAMKDIYGSYWQTSIDYCTDVWIKSQETGSLSNDLVPVIGMTLRLYTVLKSLLASNDANDDLLDAFADSKDRICSGLVTLLQLRRLKDNLPLQSIDELLKRAMADIPSIDFNEPAEIYPLVASDFQAVQSAAFDILHRVLPEAQQQISVDVLLANTDARLPEELLSLLLDAPLIHNFEDDELRELPPSIRGYLLSWHLVYDSYTTASYKVRNDYTDILKSENYIGPLLEFMFDALGHSAADPLNLEKASLDGSKLRNYDISQATDSETRERDMQWLLVNLYYLCLKFTPNLVKAWWVDCKSRQTRIAVEGWTEKYFAPLIIEDTMDEVMKWSQEQESTRDDEKELIIKVSKRSREVFAGYEVDDMMMQIVIRLPPNYPLEGVKVEGINRVAASEKKWTSWLMITQGAITFSNGSITDGLSIFRKNVIGALKGHSECAICYSIISSDKKMPEKRCQTCKNLFHSSCLFKWFASSNQSTCPLCRNPFNYGTDTARRAKDRDRGAG